MVPVHHRRGPALPGGLGDERLRRPRALLAGRTVLAVSPRRALLLLVAPLALVGCSSSSSTGTSPAATPQPILTHTVTAGPCSQVFAPGKVVSSALQAKGCTQADGGTLLVTVRPCTDGSQLAASGAVFGVVGQVAAAGGTSSSAYMQAYNHCSGLMPLAPPPK